MRRAYKSGAAAGPPSAAQATSEGYPTEGNVARGIPPTVPGPYPFYMAVEESAGLIEAAGLVPDDDPATFVNAVKVLSGIPKGTRMVFYQAAAPTGWTKVDTVDDRLLRVVSGNGGAAGGNWRISGLTIQGRQLTVNHLPAHSHGAGTLRADNAGEHQHSFDTSTGSGSTGTAARFIRPVEGQRDTGAAGTHGHAISGNTAEAGGGQAHDHGITADGNWRPAYADVIICSKD